MESKVDMTQPIRNNGSMVRQMTDRLQKGNNLQVIIADGKAVFSKQSFQADNGRQREYTAVAFTVNGKGRKDISVSQVVLIHEDENPNWCAEVEAAHLTTLEDLANILVTTQTVTNKGKKTTTVVGREFIVKVSETRTNFSGNPQVFLELA